MNYTTPDFADDVIEQLTADGYTVHEGATDETRSNGGIDAFWFCWGVDGTDIEVGEDCTTALEAWAAALQHRLANSTIPTYTETPK